MPPLSKLRLSILLLFLQLFVYLYVVPRAHHEEWAGGYPLEEHCKLSFAYIEGCPSGRTYLQELSQNCGVRREEPIPELPPVVEEEPIPEPEPEPETPAVLEQELPVVVVEEEIEVQPNVESILKEETNNSKNKLLDENMEKPTETVAKTESVHEKSGHLIYQIIVVLLFLSVSFALADCFQERAKKKANPKLLLRPRERSRQQMCQDCSKESVFGDLINQLNEVQHLVQDFSAEESERHDGLSRRMSLADLTMSRHARKESQQASYRPVGKPRNEYPFGNLMEVELTNKKPRQMRTPYNYPEGSGGVIYGRRCR